MGVDAATGSTFDHYPNPVFVTLQPEPAVSHTYPAPRPRKAGRAPGERVEQPVS